MTLVEAAERLGVQPATLRRQIALGKLTAKKRGRDWWVTPGEVARYRRDSSRLPHLVARDEADDEQGDGRDGDVGHV